MTIEKLIEDLASAIDALDLSDKVDALNAARRRLHDVSPFRDHPVDLVQWVDAHSVTANDYNPNTVAAPEMALLELSIESDGYTQPVVTWVDDERRETVDGFHRGEVGRSCETVRKQTHGYLPVTTIRESQKGKKDRVASTIRHNRARGRHRIDAMSDIVQDLAKRNWTDNRIARELGMDPDEVLRLKQISGLAELFADREFSEAWEPDE